MVGKAEHSTGAGERPVEIPQHCPLLSSTGNNRMCSPHWKTGVYIAFFHYAKLVDLFFNWENAHEMDTRSAAQSPPTPVENNKGKKNIIDDAHCDTYRHNLWGDAICSAGADKILQIIPKIAIQTGER